MSKADIIRAWKDASFRNSLSAEQRAMLPNHPAGAVQLSDEQLSGSPRTGSMMGSALCSPCPPASCF